MWEVQPFASLTIVDLNWVGLIVASGAWFPRLKALVACLAGSRSTAPASVVSTAPAAAGKMAAAADCKMAAAADCKKTAAPLYAAADVGKTAAVDRFAAGLVGHAAGRFPLPGSHLPP